MRAVLILAACAVGLSGCASGLGGAGSFDINKFLTDPACAHDDKVQGVTGAAGIPASVQFSAERHCPGSAPVAVAKPQ